MLDGYLDKLRDLRVLSGLEYLTKRRQVALDLMLKAGIPTSIFSATVTYLFLIGTLNLVEYVTWLTASTAMSLFLSPLAYYYLRSVDRGRRVESEFKYFLVSCGITSNTTSDLLTKLKTLSKWGSLFPALSRESVKLLSYKRVLPVTEALRLYSTSINSGNVRRLLGEYEVAYSLGITSEWFLDKAFELVDEIKVSTKNIIKARVTVSLIFAVLLGYLPPIAIALALIMGEALLSRFTLVSLLGVAVALAVTPKLPLHLTWTLPNPRTLIPLLALIPTLALLATGYVGTEIAAWVTVVVLGGTGTYRTLSYFRSMREITEVQKLLTLISQLPLTLANPLEVLRETLSKNKVLKPGEDARDFSISTLAEISARAKLWLTRYSLFNIYEGIKEGTISKERITFLKELVESFISDLKVMVASNVVIISIALALPLIAGSLASLAPLTDPLRFYIIASSITYSLYASYVVFNDPLNTLLPSLIIAELILGGYAF